LILQRLGSALSIGTRSLAYFRIWPILLQKAVVNRPEP
jgi:hypothetical protein